ncbi:MAG: hypothetical protein JNM17_01280 [Archangium sp.]|nr:hypothetical protein [Archangium sp.]
MSKRPIDDRQLDLPLTPKLRVIDGLGQKKTEPLLTRDAVARVLMEAGADLLLRRISHERAEAIEKQVDEILDLFDRVDDNRLLFPVLQKKLDALETLMQETREKRGRPRTVSPPGAVAPRGSARR